MTIFDSIKYTISEPPTKGELFAIPFNVFKQWYQESKITGSSQVIGKTAIHIAHFIHIAYYESPEKTQRDAAIESINLLRKLLYEYDENSNNQSSE